MVNLIKKGYKILNLKSNLKKCTVRFKSKEGCLFAITYNKVQF